MKENLKQIKKEVESELNISYDDVTKSNDYILKDKWNKLWQKKYSKLIKENIKMKYFLISKNNKSLLLINKQGFYKILKLLLF